MLQPQKKRMQMLFDALVALIITAIAIILGLTVHPVLFFIIALAVVYFVARARTRGGARSGIH
jgi:membrane protein implicated in regulation of membrane protease activity